MDGRGAIERVGGWETVRGALLAAALVAVPVAPSLAAVLGRWVPAADQPLAVAAQAGLGSLLLAAWFLHGARSLLRAAWPSRGRARHPRPHARRRGSPPAVLQAGTPGRAPGPAAPGLAGPPDRSARADAGGRRRALTLPRCRRVSRP